MKVLVVGNGKVGKAIIHHVCQEGHEVVVVDNNPRVIEQLTDQYDIVGLCGNGASYDVLENAGADKADVFIASTSSDETNILSCLVAKKLGAKSTIARVRNYEYINQIQLLKDDLGITMTINPELEAANEIIRVVNFPQAIRVDTFTNGKLDLVELYIPDDSPLIGQTLSSIHQKYQVKILVCAVQRGEEVFIPTGKFAFNAKDKIYITASRGSVRLFLNKLGLIKSKIKTIMIIGGGKIALYLGAELLKNKYQLKIIENDQKRCLELSELLQGATIICGDGSDQEVLLEEGITDTDACICLTGIDEENIIISMYAYKQNVGKIITKVNKASFAEILETINVASVISPKEITASRIVSYIRARANSRGSNVITLYKLVNNKVEALEFKAKENNKILNIPLKNLKIKDKILIAGIIREDKIIIPSGDDIIMLNDSVIVVTTNQFLDELSDILE